MSTPNADHVELTIDGETRRVAAGTTVLAALMNDGGWMVRKSVGGDSRGPLCGMGICFECRVEIDGVMQERSCMVACRPGMVVKTDFMSELAQAATPELPKGDS